ncbi:MAG: tRNA (adenosine(37)-N6)-threonylcarbamoyltransferase complex dimerization subunit type 1 TsaB [Desulfobacterales bacterium]|nr:tRNA (adenosine(37)-N6)-threonylcarbamoyltransferase complex dimerization subunit type 1 TsaB [Desulfobacterales bacterium]
MKLLAVDTSTPGCSVAVKDRETTMAEASYRGARTHSRHLMGMVRTVLDLAELSVADLDGFAVTLGPGTFTGLRIGVSAVKGLAEAADKPVVGVSSLRALAEQVNLDDRLICPFIDARRGEVYFSRFRRRDGILERETVDGVASPGEAVQEIREPCLFVGGGAALYRETILDALGPRAFFAPDDLHTIRGAVLASLGMARLARGEVVDLHAFTPVYIRKSDAELNLESRRALERKSGK